VDDSLPCLHKIFLNYFTNIRVIQEITEGSKVLEDQLKLMDEKYLELRAKLDLSRDYFSATVKKYRKEGESLRLKFSYSNQGQLLDHVKVPKGYSASSTNLLGQAPSGSFGKLCIRPQLFPLLMLNFQSSASIESF
jgi:hypothetical protein